MINPHRVEAALVALNRPAISSPIAMASAPATPSRSHVPKGSTADMIELMGVGVDSIVSHGAGHILADWHTDQFDLLPNLRDQGGSLSGKIALGPARILGTADDLDVDFGPDTYVPKEGSIGTEDTLDSIAFGQSTGTGRGRR